MHSTLRFISKIRLMYSTRIQLLVMLVLFVFTASGQSAILRQIEKGKYSDAEKRISKAMSKTPEDVAVLYTKSVLLMTEKYKGFSPIEAYATLQTTIDLFSTLADEKELRSLERVPINLEVLNELNDSICEYALQQALEQKAVGVLDEFLEYYKKAPQDYVEKAIATRNEIAYAEALLLNNEAGFQYFIDTYPNAVQISEAILKRNTSAFEQALSMNTNSAYVDFISRYPGASQVPIAHEKIEENDYNDALANGSSGALLQFLEQHPVSDKYGRVFNLMEDQVYKEETLGDGKWTTYRNFIQKHPQNKHVSTASDLIFKIATQEKDRFALEYVVDQFFDIRRSEAAPLLFDFYRADGERSSLEQFLNKYGRVVSDSLLVSALGPIASADNLYLHLRYNERDSAMYRQFIQEYAPNERAFVALQRLISDDVAVKKWASALKTVQKFQPYFGTDHTKFNSLKALLEKPIDSSIQIHKVGEGVNTVQGSEYMPVISGDETIMYFCGNKRADNLGGEDIFSSQFDKGKWAEAQIVGGLSSANSNDAPLSISADGTRMLLFQEGSLYYSEKTVAGWGEPEWFPQHINAANWQSDAMITSNGRGLLFASTRSGGYNLSAEQQIYHGDNLYPSDIYISQLGDDGQWGAPINLGPVVNTPYSDRMPFLHPDMKTLYFSSDGHGGLGKMDVFMTTRLADSCWTCWSEPINLGKEINTQESDAGYKISTTGDKAYFSFAKKSNDRSSVIFLVDVSGSMHGQKLQSLKEATIAACETALNNNAEVAVLAFAGSCTSPIAADMEFTSDIRVLTNFINRLNANGGTPMYEAYLYACNYMKTKSNSRSKNKVVVLMTDGDANGCTNLSSMFNDIGSRNAKFRTQTIAYDVAYNSQAFNDLEQIAAFSDGKFYPSMGSQSLGTTFEAASNDIFSLNTTDNNSDIYWVDLPVYLRPGLVATISGFVTDINNQPISVEIKWEDLETGEAIGQSFSDPNTGRFFITLPLGKMYGYFINKDKHFPVSNNVDLRKTVQPVKIEQNIQIFSFDQMIEKGVAIPVNNLFFDFAQSTLQPTSIPELKRVARIIQDNQMKVELSGHTDAVGDDQRNQSLSEQRASTVRQFLIKEGCNASSLSAVGFGKTRPVETNDTDEGRAKNRRVEIKFIK